MTSKGRHLGAKRAFQEALLGKTNLPVGGNKFSSFPKNIRQPPLHSFLRLDMPSTGGDCTVMTSSGQHLGAQRPIREALLEKTKTHPVGGNKFSSFPKNIS